LDYAWKASSDCVVFSAEQHSLHLKAVLKWRYEVGTVLDNLQRDPRLAEHMNGITYMGQFTYLLAAGHLNNTPTVTSGR